jgi:hypothetical protein
MSKLICSAINCLSNIDGLCTAKTIHINGGLAKKTYCETFSNRTLKSALASMTNINLVGEIRQAFNKDNIVMNPNILCRASDCSYNMKGQCVALNVQIYGATCNNNQCTQCETFQ